MTPHVSESVVPPQQLLPIVVSPTIGLRSQEEVEENEEEQILYRPIPPRKSVTMVVRYRFRGRGKPLPYDLAEEEGA